MPKSIIRKDTNQFMRIFFSSAKTKTLYKKFNLLLIGIIFVAFHCLRELIRWKDVISNSEKPLTN